MPDSGELETATHFLCVSILSDICAFRSGWSKTGKTSEQLKISREYRYWSYSYKNVENYISSLILEAMKPHTVVIVGLAVLNFNGILIFKEVLDLP